MLRAQRRRNDEFRDPLAQGLVSPIAERCFRGRIELDDATGFVDRDDTIERGGDQRRVQRRARLELFGPYCQCLLGALELSEIACQREHAVGRAFAHAVRGQDLLDIPLRAGALCDPPFPASRLASQSAAGEVSRLGVEVRPSHLRSGHPDEIFGVEPKKFEEVAVPVEVAQIGADDGDACGDGVEQRRQQLRVGLVEWPGLQRRGHGPTVDGTNM